MPVVGDQLYQIVYE